jgi:selenocysteine-specific elongation factor
MHVIGTAGHVDHGKSTLVAALTGIEPDRLQEEIRREMTIDLGFAWMKLPGGETLGIVDVPGHRDFIDNMLAGVGGIDAAIFVIAADEGIMPQTREHLAILDLLQIRGGVVVLTKIDLAPDPDWLDLVEGEIRQIMAGTVLENAPIIRTSAKTGAGLPELAAAIQQCLEKQPAHTDLHKPRLPVDRVFTLTGFGTVVTGTLQGGGFSTGDEVEILPAGIRTRIRGLQSYKQKVVSAEPGSRTAVNLAGINLDQVRRGDVLIHPGTLQSTRRMDAWVKLLPDASTSLQHNQHLKFYLNTSITQTRIRLLGSDEIKPGGTGWIQLEFEEEIVAEKGDHYILRLPSPGETLGGGMIVDPHPAGRYKRYSPGLIRQMEARLQGSPEEKLVDTLERNGPIAYADLGLKSGVEAGRIVGMVPILRDQGAIRAFPSGAPVENTILLSAGNWERMTQRMQTVLSDYHTHHPLKRGMPREELKSRLQLPVKEFSVFTAEWIKENRCVQQESTIRLPEFKVVFTADQTRRMNTLLQEFAAHPFTPPSVKDCIEAVGADVYAAMVESELLRQVSPEVVFREADYQDMYRKVRQFLMEQNRITVVQFRDMFSASRKYALGFLEYLDKTGITLRDGDYRTLKKNH